MTKEEALKILCSGDIDALLSHYSYEEIQQAIDLVVAQPSLPSNLDEAAEKSAEKVCGVLLADRFPFIQGFKSGAEWMAGQGVSFDTEMSWLDSFGFQIGWPEDTSIFDCFNGGDKVVVQIRKK